jgi:hypothetical protein
MRGSDDSQSGISTVLLRLRCKFDIFANSVKMFIMVCACELKSVITTAVSSANALARHCGSVLPSRRNNKSAAIANNRGDNGQPWRTPLVAVKLGNVLPFTLM